MTTRINSCYQFIPPYMYINILEDYKKTKQIQLLDQQNDCIKFINQNHALLNNSGQEITLPPSAETQIEVFHFPTRLIPNDQSLNSCSNPEATACYDNMSKISKFFKDIFRQTVTPSNHMKAYIYDVRAYNNAAWIPSQDIVAFGTVDSRIFSPLTYNLEVMAHEFGHAVTHYSSNIKYRGQSGALNESISDVFAIMAKHYQANAQANGADTNWLIGESIIVNAQQGNSLRSMSDPGSAYKDHPVLESDPQPSHMRDYRPLSEDEENDWGGVHLYSGIPNRAFSLAAKSIGGGSWETIGKIWYNTIIHADRDDNFTSFALRTLQITKDLGFENGVFNAVGQAWQDVGVDLRLINFSK